MNVSMTMLMLAFVASVGLASALPVSQEACMASLKDAVREYEIPADVTDLMESGRIDLDSMNPVVDNDDLSDVKLPKEGCYEMINFFASITEQEPCAEVEMDNHDISDALKTDAKLATFWKAMQLCYNVNWHYQV